MDWSGIPIWVHVNRTGLCGFPFSIECTSQLLQLSMVSHGGPWPNLNDVCVLKWSKRNKGPQHYYIQSIRMTWEISYEHTHWNNGFWRCARYCKFIFTLHMVFREWNKNMSRILSGAWQVTTKIYMCYNWTSLCAQIMLTVWIQK